MKDGALRPIEGDITHLGCFVLSDIQIPWVKNTNDWECSNDSENVTHSGIYNFDNTTNKITVHTNDTNSSRTSTVIYTNSGVFFADFKKTFYSGKMSNKTLPELGINIYSGSIQPDIQAKQIDCRYRTFVLPSQLNGAEYPSATDDSIVKEVNQYKSDLTAGPRGQIGADPAIAQFIIDNASNNERTDKGINNIRSMGQMNGITLKNGYLDINEKDADIEKFKNNLQHMTILGVKNVAVVGLDSTYMSFVNKDHTVDLIYASAVPLVPDSEWEGYCNNDPTGDNTVEIANMILYAQYSAAMKLVALHRPASDLYLLPLGGGVFNNKANNIKRAIGAAFLTHKEKLKSANVNVHVLTWMHSESNEYNEYNNKIL